MAKNRLLAALHRRINALAAGGGTAANALARLTGLAREGDGLGLVGGNGGAVGLGRHGLNHRLATAYRAALGNGGAGGRINW